MRNEKQHWKRIFFRTALRLWSLPAIFRDGWHREREQWILWTGPLLAGGIALYFSLPVEPPLWVGAVALLVSSLPLFAAWKSDRPVIFFPFLALTLLSAGFFASQGRCWLVSAPRILLSTGPVRVSGLVRELEPLGRKWRVLLESVRIEGIEPEETPERVRIILYDRADILPGQEIALRAEVSPPPRPVAPGEYDFARQAWFDRLGGAGFALSPPRILSSWRDSEDSGGKTTEWLNAFTEQVRLQVLENFLRHLPPGQGTVAAALVTGQQGGIPQDVIVAYRDSGLAHLLAISGMNIGLAAGLFFVVVRAGLSLVPPLALRMDTKKVTAFLAIVAIAGYTAISGGSVPAVRSFLMGACVFGAVLADRSPLSMRVLVLSAVLILLVEPESLTGASFQMSYAAVLALMAGYEATVRWQRRWKALELSPAAALMRAVALYAGGVLLSTLIAGTATAPYSLYHFHRYTVYSVLANAVAVPLTAFWVMPWLVLSLVLMPLGLEFLAMPPLGWGLEVIEQVAREVAGWPAASVQVPPLSVTGLALFSLGGVWLCFWQHRWRWAGLPVMLLAVSSAWWGSEGMPDVLVNEKATVLAVRQGDSLLLSPGRSSSWLRQVWARRWPAAEGWDQVMGCDSAGCVSADGRLIWIRHPSAWEEACEEGFSTPPAGGTAGAGGAMDSRRILVSALPAPPWCRQPLILDGTRLGEQGATALWLDGDGSVRRLQTVAQGRGQRPWTADTPAEED